MYSSVMRLILCNNILIGYFRTCTSEIVSELGKVALELRMLRQVDNSNTAEVMYLWYAREFLQ